VVAGLVVSLAFMLVLTRGRERVEEEVTKILDELASVGFAVDSVDELRNSGVNYAEAVPALLRELTRETDPRKKEWIVRALSVPWARPAAIEPLLEEFRTLPHDETRDNDNTRWAIGNAFEILWDDTYFEDFAALARERKYGRSRQMLVLGFGKSKCVEQAVVVLLELCDDPTVEGHAISALAKLAHPAARDALQNATTHSQAWVRKAAVRGLAKVDRKAAGSSNRSFPHEGFRRIHRAELRLLERFLAREFAGNVELREQLHNVVVADIDADGSLGLATRSATPAVVNRRIPVEASYLDRDGGRVHLLLHVVDGYLDEFEVFREDSGPVISRPVDQTDLDFE
jgi:hypothetical protein